tara:strand:- start:4 stop:618 length:615 start_codon:yes stop_codon:yes gene_type:complete
MSIVTLNDRAVRSVTTFGSVSGGSMVFIKKLTASSSASLSFVNGSSDVVLDSTYKEYMFTFKNIHAGTDGAELTVGFRDGSTDYDATKTTTVFEAYYNEAGNDSGVAYQTAEDLAQATGFQNISKNLGTDNDQNAGGYLHLFNPSSTTFVKHFISRLNNYQHNEYSLDYYVAGYCNVTTAIDAVQFKMSSGNIDSGDICLYGIL